MHSTIAQVLRFWEALWAAPHDHFHVWAVFAVLQLHRRPLMEAAADGYDGLLKYCIQVTLCRHLFVQSHLVSLWYWRETPR